MIKKTLLALLALLFFIVLSIWIAAQFMNPGTISHLVSKQLSAATAQESRIDGDVVWQLFPRPGIKVSRIQIGESNKANPYSLQIDHLLLNLEITPLLRGNLVFNELEIDGVKLTLNPNAPSNLISNVSQPAKTEARDNNRRVRFSINSFLVTHGNISMKHRQNTIEISDLQLRAKQLNLKNVYFPLQIKAGIATSIAKHRLATTFQYKGHVQLKPTLLNHPDVAWQHLNVDGNLSLRNTELDQLKIEKISTNAVKKQNKLILNPFNITFYSGKSIGDVQYQFASKQLSFNQTASHIDVNKLFYDAFNQTIINGNLDFTIHADVNTADPDWKKSLRGDGNVTIKDGTLYFVDIHNIITKITSSVHTLINQPKFDIKTITQLVQPYLTMQQQKGETDFQLLSVQYRMSDGKFMDDALLLQTEQLQLKGNGQINLKDYAIDNQMSVKLVTSDDKVNQVQKLLGGSFPFKVNGNVSKPHILPYIPKLNPMLAQQLFHQPLAQPVKEIREQFKNFLKAE